MAHRKIALPFTVRCIADCQSFGNYKAFLVCFKRPCEIALRTQYIADPVLAYGNGTLVTGTLRSFQGALKRSQRITKSALMHMNVTRHYRDGIIIIRQWGRLFECCNSPVPLIGLACNIRDLQKQSHFGMGCRLPQ